MAAKTVNRKPVRKLKRLFLFLLLVITSAVAVVFIILLIRRQEDLALTPAEKVKKETAATIAAIGKLMVLPGGEEPTIASVADITKLASQPFFTNAKNGDKVLIYNKARKAILYRPETNMIIEVAPVTIATGSGSTTAGTPVQSPPGTNLSYSIVLWNGTDVTGLTKKYEPVLTSKISKTTVLERSNAKSMEYDKSMVIDLTGTHKSDATNIASTLGFITSELPKGETKPSKGDFLIILGLDAVPASPSPTPTK